MKKRLLLFFIAAILLSGCATYHISVESLQAQLKGTKVEMKENLLIPVDNIYGNGLANVKVLDKHDKEHTIHVNKHTGVRITQKDGKRTTFYFETLLLFNGTINGSKTHLFNAHIKPIRFEDISKIEIQK